MLVGQPNFLRAVGVDREDARANQIEARELQQGRVADLRDQGPVGRLGFVGGQQLGHRLGRRALEGESAHRRPARHRDQQLGLHTGARGVPQGDVQRGGGGLLHYHHPRYNLGYFPGCRGRGADGRNRREHMGLRHDDMAGTGQPVRGRRGTRGQGLARAGRNQDQGGEHNDVDQRAGRHGRGSFCESASPITLNVLRAERRNCHGCVTVLQTQLHAGIMSRLNRYAQCPDQAAR